VAHPQESDRLEQVQLSVCDLLGHCGHLHLPLRQVQPATLPDLQSLQSVLHVQLVTWASVACIVVVVDYGCLGEVRCFI